MRHPKVGRKISKRAACATENKPDTRPNKELFYETTSRVLIIRVDVISILLIQPKKNSKMVQSYSPQTIETGLASGGIMLPCRS